MSKNILSYSEKDAIFKILDCSVGYNKSRYDNLSSNADFYLFQVKNNMETFFHNYEKEMKWDDIKSFAKTKYQVSLLVKAMDTIYNSDSVFQKNDFIYGILYTAKLIDNNQINQARPVHHSKQIVMDIIKYREILKKDFNTVFLKNDYVYDKSHIELFIQNIKTFSFLAMKIKQIYQLKNYLIYNINYLKKVNYNSLVGVKSYSKLLENRKSHITSLADIDPNEDNDYFGRRFDNRKKDYDDDLNMDTTDIKTLLEEW